MPQQKTKTGIYTMTLKRTKGKYIFVQERNKKNPQELRMQSLNPLVNSIHSHSSEGKDSEQRLRLPTADGMSVEYTEEYQMDRSVRIEHVKISPIPSSYKQEPYTFTPTIIYNEVIANDTTPELNNNKWKKYMVTCVQSPYICKYLPFAFDWILQPTRAIRWHVDDIVVDEFRRNKIKETIGEYLEALTVQVTGYKRARIKREIHIYNIDKQKIARIEKILETKATIRHNYVNSFKSPKNIDYTTKIDSEYSINADKSPTNITTNTPTYPDNQNNTEITTTPIPAIDKSTNTSNTDNPLIHDERSADSQPKLSLHTTVLNSSAVIWLAILSILVAIGYALRRRIPRPQHNIRPQSTQQQSNSTRQSVDQNTQNSSNSTTIEEATQEPLTNERQEEAVR